MYEANYKNGDSQFNPQIQIVTEKQVNYDETTVQVEMDAETVVSVKTINGPDS